MGPVESHFLLHSLYNMEMGFFNHRDPIESKNNPLACVRAFKAEDPFVDSVLEDLAYRYRKNKINKRYDINFLDYIKLPVTVTRQLDRIGDEVLKSIEKEEAEAEARAIENITKPK